MCGIAGIIFSSGQPADSLNVLPDLETMCTQLAHRGPDGAGYWSNASNQVQLGHRRLAVIDTSAAAAQPMHYAGRFTITYNGELYNYRELRAELISLGHQFLTQSDTEVILASYAEYKENCLAKFDGMFALAIWDELEQRLFLARDRFGEKPLFITAALDGKLLFASEMKAFWAIGCARNFDPNHALLFLATGLSNFPLAPEQTSYRQIQQLPAAHYMYIRVQSDGYTAEPAKPYWDLDINQRYEGSSQQAAAELRLRLSQSVQMRLRSDVACGTSLSGGIDSGSVAAFIGAGKNGRYQGFSAVFPGFEKDESGNIQELSALFSLESRQCKPQAADLLSYFDRLLWHQEEPIGSAGVLVQFMVNELAKSNGITVLLDGQGADEVLAGYHNYIPWFLQEQWRSGAFKNFRREKKLFQRHEAEFSWGIKNYAAALFPHSAQLLLLKKQQRQIETLPMVQPDFLAGFDAAPLLYKPMVTGFNDILYYDTTMSRLPELLRYADRNSMAHGRETRLPFLQHELVQWIFSFPPHFKMQDGFTKWILRKSMDEILPANICWQKKKIAFEPPQLQWMQNDIVQERIQAARTKLVQQGILHKKVLNTRIHARSAYNRFNYDWRYWVLASLY